MIKTFCLNLVAKSPYKDIRYDSKTGTIIPANSGLKTLRDHINYIRPISGFQPDISGKDQ